MSTKRLWILADLYVHPEIRRQGVSKALMERAQQLAIDTGAKRLILDTAPDNRPAQSLYESLGWKRDTFYHYSLDV